tara:strand:+ start:850 stop:1443 length:594 start_codon:yes stop_codon:yes gene_type:complete
MPFDTKSQDFLKKVNKEAFTKLSEYLLLIKKWNKTRNLVSRKLTDHDLENHIIDCVALNEVISENNILDVGTGAGLPGVVIALLNPTKKVKLLDSNLKKISFLNHVKTKLTMKNVTIEHNRLEKCDLSQEKLIVCRAFTSPVELINMVRKKLPKKSTILMMISKDQETSIQGFKTEYIPSSAEDILEKKRGFLRITI